MDDHIGMHTAVFLTTTIATVCFFILTTPPQSYCQELPDFNSRSTVCSTQPYNCGKVFNISYPFWGNNRPNYCGASDQFMLTCDAHQKTTSIIIASQTFTVLAIDTINKTITLQTELASDVCSSYTNTTLNTLFSYTTNVENITIFSDCPSGVSVGGNNFTCQNGSAGMNFFYLDADETLFQQIPGLKECASRIHVPASRVGNQTMRDIHDLKRALEGGFEAYYTHFSIEQCRICVVSGGSCQRSDSDGFACVCSNGIHGSQCSSNKSQLNFSRKISIGVGSAIMGGLMMCIIICCCKCTSSARQVKFRLTIKNDRDIEAFLKKHEALAQKRYKFSEVKKMTNSFKVKLGQGGFGAVYKGELLNGCPVAVKILNESRGNGEEFINEVASISRTSHVNVVTLLGFCLEGKKKALIYEFMPNGSLDKFIHNKGLEITPSLSWDNLWQIAIGIARGLEYLHRGCNTRILHFDIKPHNILLDENFCPKISDFGLAKLCPRKDSIISMSDARGTMGYVAPEVWNRHFGGVSHKSDVYSYGMMLLEMVGGRKNINAEASNTSEIYFPHWVYNRLEQGSDLRPDGMMATEENEIARRMTLVGLWCIQTLPNDRPTMSRVVDMLEGHVNSLEMPPKPILSSPTRSIPESPST